MKYYRPRTLIKEEIQKPVQAIGVIAVMALAIAMMALFFAIGKDNNAT